MSLPDQWEVTAHKWKAMHDDAITQRDRLAELLRTIERQTYIDDWGDVGCSDVPLSQIQSALAELDKEKQQ